MWSWPSLVFVTPGAFAASILRVYPKAWRWIAVVSVMLTAWWFAVASYGFYDHFRAEADVRGGSGVDLLLAALFLMVGLSTAVILSLGRTSGGSGAHDGVLG
jgi:hypothetical protein